MSMTGITIYSEEQVIQALRNHLGNIDLASKELVVTRGELVTYIANHPEVLEARKQIKEGIKDEAEDLLVQGMRTDSTLLMFFLKTQAKDRGYGNQSHTTITGADGNPIEVNVNARALIALMQKAESSLNEEENESSEYTERKLLEEL